MAAAFFTLEYWLTPTARGEIQCDSGVILLLLNMFNVKQIACWNELLNMCFVWNKLVTPEREHTPFPLSEHAELMELGVLA